jgi:hypothetical protein
VQAFLPQSGSGFQQVITENRKRLVTYVPRLPIPHTEATERLLNPGFQGTNVKDDFVH